MPTATESEDAKQKSKAMAGPLVLFLLLIASSIVATAVLWSVPAGWLPGGTSAETQHRLAGLKAVFELLAATLGTITAGVGLARLLVGGGDETNNRTSIAMMFAGVVLVSASVLSPCNCT